MNDEMATPVDSRRLRKIIWDATAYGILTKGEIVEIAKIVDAAIDREIGEAEQEDEINERP